MNEDALHVNLSDLIRSLPGYQDATGMTNEITGISSDSRQVKPGDLFVALSGGTTDGHRFIPQALQRGAQAVVGTQPLENLPVPYLRVADSRLALAHLSAAFYDFPARKLLMIGVTGTDGKTTTANLLFRILKTAGLQAGMISTVNAVIGDQALDTGFHVTTPDAPDIQRYLYQMVTAGLTHVVLEATSHGLAQSRVAACDFDVGVLTNITHEHLDYHGSYQAYRAAKASLFTSLVDTPPKPFDARRGAVLNRDDRSYEYLSAITEVQQVSYGQHPQADLQAQEVVHHHAGGIQFIARAKEFTLQVNSPLEGDFNVSNCLAAIATTVNILGLNRYDVRKGIAKFEGVPGRMERIKLGQPFTAIVDFAHTPNALRRALETARLMVASEGRGGRVIAVFGSAGLRDRAKRRMMAETSAELADLTILTAEDPRTESLHAILAEMAAGAEARGLKEGVEFWRVPDRGQAIRTAVRLARPGDVIIVCGKGHEQSMCFGETEFPWDDRLATRAALTELLGLPGPVMPYLPTQEGD